MKLSAIKKAGISLLLILGMLLSLSLSLFVSASPAPAEPLPEKLVTLTEVQNVNLVIWFDKELPGVTFTAPDGSQLPLSENTPGIRLMVGEEWATVEITNAAAGDWYIAIDERSNTEVSYRLMGVAENLWIQYLTVTPLSDGRVEVSFLTELGDQRTSYQYELCLTADFDQAGEVSLRTGSAYTGSEQRITVDLTDHSSYESYLLILYVHKTTSEVELFDTFESEPFRYENPETLQAPDGIDVEVNLTTRMLKANWADYRNWRYDSYFLSIVATDTDEAIYYSEFESDEDQVSQYIDEAYSSLTLSFYGRRDGKLSEPVIRTVELGTDPCISILTQSPTASSQAQVKMNLPKDALLQVSVDSASAENGEDANTYEFTSDGDEDTVAVDLVNGNNKIEASATLNDVLYYCTLDLYKDGFPPTLSFFEPYDGQNYTDASLTIVGNVSDAVRLLLGEEEIAVDEYGNFSVDVKLVPGENKLAFVAEDGAGNRTARTIYLHGAETITAAGKLAKVSQNYLPLILAGAVSLGVIVFAIVLCVRTKKLKAFSFASLIVFFSAVTVGTAIGLIYQFVHRSQLERTSTSMEFAKLIKESPSEALALLEELEAMPEQINLWMGLTIAAVGVLLLVILAAVVFKKIVAYRAKPKTPKPPKPPKAPKAPKTPVQPAPAAEQAPEPEAATATTPSASEEDAPASADDLPADSSDEAHGDQ